MIVTIVTPTFNAVEYLKECIESVQRNATSSIQVEHIIVDGGSTDGTIEVAEGYGLRILKGKDKGIFDAINKGSFNSSGELLGFLGADDVMLDRALEPVVDLYRKSGSPWVVGGIRWIDSRGASLGELAAPPTWMTLRMYACIGWNPLMHMATFFTRDFYTELGGYNIDYKVAGDFEMFSRALERSRFARLGRPVSCFRRTRVNFSMINPKLKERDLSAILERFGPNSHPERMFWRYVMKVWLNFRNPAWLMHKLRESVGVKLGLMDQAHF